jgi:predicted restriction endonuclease
MRIYSMLSAWRFSSSELFDGGAFALTDELQLCVSEKANGSTGLPECLTYFHGLPLKALHSRDYLPIYEHLGWHRKEVFHGPGRELNAVTQLRD